MRCVSPLCDAGERLKHVQNFMYRMQLSGYQKEQRVNVYKAAKKRYDQQIKNNIEGITPLYRSKQWNRKERCREKELRKKSWCGKYEATYFVQATPGSQLAKQCQKVFRNCNLNISVTERSGRTIKQMLMKSNPFASPPCSCEVCHASAKRICRVRECVYELACSLCGVRYIGETCRSLYERYLEHMTMLKRRDKNSALFQHSEEKHKADVRQIKWNVKVLQRCPGDPALRQATEATLIRINKPELNRKVDFGDSNRARRRLATSTSVPLIDVE